MSDVEEPPTKVCKIEDPPTPETLEGIATEDESMMDEGQEEWLSEGVLTDDDFNQSVENDKNDSNFGNISQISQDENLPINDLIEQLDSSINTDHEEDKDTVHGAEDGKENGDVQDKNTEDPGEKLDSQDEKPPDAVKDSKVESKADEQTIEETLNNFEGAKERGEDNMEALVSGKNNGESVEKQPADVKMEKTSDDGNDTDDLLRMLGEGENKSKKKVMKMSKDAQIKDEQSTDDEDEYVYQDAKLTKYGSTKKSLPTKAVPENMSDGDDESDVSSDEAGTVQRMFSLRPKSNVASKSTAKSSLTSQKRMPLKRIVELPTRIGGKLNQSTPKPAQLQNQKLLKSKVVSSLNTQKKLDSSKPDSRIMKSVSSTRKVESSTHKFELNTRKYETVNKSETNTQRLGSSHKSEQISKKLQPGKSELSTRKSESSTQKLSKFDALKADMAKLKDENEEIIDEEEFLEDDDDIDLDEDEFAEDSDLEEQSKGKQKLMKPEMMEEEVPSDEESHSENGSLYDELPSSESEDMDDWFNLDIRAERAADYLPFLGSRARELLLEEKRRVMSRLDTLRQSLTALTDSARSQADQIRNATTTLAELDDMLKAT